MRTAIALASVLLLACGDAGITPDPTGAGGSSANAGPTVGAGGETGQGGATTTSGTGGDGGSETMGGAYESGSRLKAQALVGSDGSRTPMPAMHDTQLDVDCTYALAADGVQRCLPVDAAPISGYAEGTCTMALVSSACPLFGYTSALGAQCPRRRSVYAIGSPVVLTGAFYVKNGTSCSGIAVPAGVTFYAVGGEMAPQSFVAGTVEVEP